MIHMLTNVRKQMFFHAESVYPEECCGLLLGAEIDVMRKITGIIEVPNAEGARRDHRFLITPEYYRKAEVNAKEMNVKLLGFYHSHPDHKALPSKYDIEHGIPWFVSIIIAVTGGTASHMTAWILNENRMRYDQQSLLVQ